MASNLLNEDLIIEVLSWLPVKSLKRFTSVCKYWYTLLTDNPSVFKLHLNHSNQNPKVLIHNRRGRKIVYSLDYKTDRSRPKEITPPFKTFYDFKILGSCNGLFCIRKVTNRKGDNDLLCLWNPSTGESKELPETSVEFDNNVPCRIRIFHRTKYTVYGFGYDRISDDYKVIRCVYFYGKNSVHNYEVKVYTLSTNSWRRISGGKNLFKPRRDAPKETGLFFNGGLHWIIKNQEGSIVLFCFDIECEEYREVPKPHFLDKEEEDFNVIVFLNLQVLNGCLCILHCDKTLKDYVDVWVMNDYGVKGSWNILFTIKRESIVGFGHDHIQNLCYKPLRFYENGEVLLMLNSEDLILYDPKREKSNYLIKYRYVRHGFDSEAYVESLIALKSCSCVDQGLEQDSSKMKRKRRGKRGRARTTMGEQDDNVLSDFDVHVLSLAELIEKSLELCNHYSVLRGLKAILLEVKRKFENLDEQRGQHEIQSKRCSFRSRHGQKDLGPCIWLICGLYEKKVS